MGQVILFLNYVISTFSKNWLLELWSKDFTLRSLEIIKAFQKYGFLEELFSATTRSVSYFSNIFPIFNDRKSNVLIMSYV